MSFTYTFNGLINLQSCSLLKEEVLEKEFMKYFFVDNFKVFSVRMDIQRLSSKDQELINDGEFPLSYFYYWMNILSKINEFKTPASWCLPFKKKFYVDTLETLLDLMTSAQLWENYETAFIFIWGEKINYETIFKSINQCDGILFPSHGGEGMTCLLNEKSFDVMKPFLGLDWDATPNQNDKNAS